MKKLLFSLAVLTGAAAYAQTPVGTVVNNFTLTDINGNSHSLFNYLDQGKWLLLTFQLLGVAHVGHTTILVH